MLNCFNAAEKCGLQVLALSSDLDGPNTSLWTSLGVHVEKYGKRVNYFQFNKHEIDAKFLIVVIF